MNIRGSCEPSPDGIFGTLGYPDEIATKRTLLIRPGHFSFPGTKTCKSLIDHFDALSTGEFEDSYKRTPTIRRGAEAERTDVKATHRRTTAPVIAVMDASESLQSAKQNATPSERATRGNSKPPSEACAADVLRLEGLNTAHVLCTLILVNNALEY